MIQPARRPRNRFFVWTDPHKRHDLVVFLGETQPPVGKFLFCKEVIDFARNLGVERVITFAAMATGMRPEHMSRVFGAATDEEGVAELRRLDTTVLEEGNIGGLNGVLLGAAAQTAGCAAVASSARCRRCSPRCRSRRRRSPSSKRSPCSPASTSTWTNSPSRRTRWRSSWGNCCRASRSSTARSPARPMRTKTTMTTRRSEDEASIEFSTDVSEPESAGGQEGVGYQYEDGDEPVAPPAVERIEELFARAADDRKRAFELKRELDRLGLFKRYEDRFLDLFKK